MARISTAVRSLTTFAWHVLDTNPNTPQTGHLRACVEQFEDAADNLTFDVKIVACQMLRAGSMLTGEAIPIDPDDDPDYGARFRQALQNAAGVGQ